MRLSNKLPLGWKWVKLGETCEIIMGQSPPSITYNIERDGIPFFQGKGDFGEIYPTARVWCKCPLKIARPGDVLISVRAPVGSVNIANDMSCIGRGLAALRPNNSLDVLWLFYYLRLHEDQISALGKGSTFSAITKTDLDSIFIPLPSLSEQKRILARINDLFSRIREAKRLRHEAQQEAERLWQSVLADTFPKPGTKLPNGWQWVKLEDIAQVFSGSSAPQDEEYFTEGKYPFVRVSDLSSSVDGYITKTRDAVNDKAIKELKLIKAAAGTIVFPKSGAAILTNARAILAIDAYIVSHLAALSPDRSKADKDWLYYYLSTVDMGQYSDNPSYPSLKLSRIKNIEIPLPNLIKQREIVAYLKCIHEKVQSIKEAQMQTEAELQSLEQAILDKAFRGEL